MRSRYRADRDEIPARYAEWETLGDVEIRDFDQDARSFRTYTSPLDAALRRYNDGRPN
jgi:hypothetical protein